MPAFSLEEQIISEPSPGQAHFPAFAITPELESVAEKKIEPYQESRRSAVLPLLHLLQEKFGYISAEAINYVAQKLKIEPIQVLEVVTFYPGFRQSAPGRFHIRICRTLSCAMAGSDALMQKICELTGIDRSHANAHHNPISVSSCGKWSVEFVECLASCGSAPVCLVNDDFHENVTSEKAGNLVGQYSSKS